MSLTLFDIMNYYIILKEYKKKTVALKKSNSNKIFKNRFDEVCLGSNIYSTYDQFAVCVLF